MSEQDKTFVPHKIFISGPMTGYENYNEAGFKAAEKSLRDQGYEPISPWNQQLIDAGNTWRECMFESLMLMLEADSIVYLPGHENSKGSTIEAKFAAKMGLPEANVKL